MKLRLPSLFHVSMLILFSGVAQAQTDAGTLKNENVAHNASDYSPFVDRHVPDKVLWGDTHLHTGLSVDAGLFGCRLGLDEAYRFARGEQVMASSGQPAKLGRPLDKFVWMRSPFQKRKVAFAMKFNVSPKFHHVVLADRWI